MKTEALVIIFGLTSVIVLVAIHLVIKAKSSRKEKLLERELSETVSAIKEGSSMKYPSGVTLTFNKNAIKETSYTANEMGEPKKNLSSGTAYGTYNNEYKSVGEALHAVDPRFPNVEKSIKKEKKKRDQAPTQDYLVEEDKALLRRVESNDGNFLTSMLVAEVTDSALLGTIVGGDPLGAIVGDMINDSDNSSDDWSSSSDNDSSSDYSSSDSDYSSSDSFSTDW